MAKLGDIEWQTGNSPDDLIRDLRTFRKEFISNLDTKVKLLTEVGVQYAKRLAPVASGELRDKIRGNVEKMAEVVIMQIIPEAEHSIYQEFGTVYQEAQPFLRPTLKYLEPLVVKHVSAAWDDAIAAV